MANISKYLAFTISSVLLFQNLTFSQEVEWIKKTSKDEKIAVNYRIYNSAETDEQVIEYETVTTEELDFNKCIKMMQEVTNHKDFSDDTEDSYKINDISENESLVYYFIDAPWPMPNADCVSIMTYNKDPIANVATFELIADADLLVGSERKLALVEDSAAERFVLGADIDAAAKQMRDHQHLGARRAGAAQLLRAWRHVIDVELERHRCQAGLARDRDHALDVEGGENHFVALAEVHRLDQGIEAAANR